MLQAGDMTLTPLKVSNGAKAGTFPSRLKILDWGRNETLKGTFLVDEKTVEMFGASQRALGKDRVALDYEHNTVPGSDEFERSQEPRQVAAYWTPKVIAGEGLFLEAPDWTPSGKLNAHNYEDLSAAPIAVKQADGTQRVIGLHSAALTRAGASEVTFFNAGNAEVQGMISTLSATHKIEIERREIVMKEGLLIEELAVAIGLKADATKAEVLKRLGGALVILCADSFQSGTNPIAKLTEDFKAVAALEQRVKGVEGKIAELPRTVATLSMTQDGRPVPLSVDDLVGRLTKIEKAQLDTLTASQAAERGALVARFSAEGKVPLGEDGKALSSEALHKLEAPVLRMLLNSTPATVPLSARSRVSPGGGGTEAKGLARIRSSIQNDPGFKREMASQPVG